MEQKLHICEAALLGDIRLQIDGREKKIRLKRAAAVLYYLLIQKRASREELTNLIWPEEQPELARRHLRDNLHHLKKVCEQELIVPNGRAALELNPAMEFQVDAELFQASECADLYRGEFLKGFYLDRAAEYELWLVQMRNQFRELYLSRLEKQGREAHQTGRTEEAERLFRAYLKEEPVSETVSADLMQLYRERREYGRASSVYRALYDALEGWFGIAPQKEVSELYYAMMDEWNRMAEEKGLEEEELLIGRRKHLRRMARRFQGGNTGEKPCSMVLLGEAGVGKSHLLNYCLKKLDLSSRTVLTASCFKSRKRELLYPWQAIMASLHAFLEREEIRIPKALAYSAAQLFPVFSGEKEPPALSASQKDSAAAYEGALTLLAIAASKKPLLLVFEDIQWMDSASLQFLDKLMHRLMPEQFVFWAACRKPADPALSACLETGEEDHLLECCELEPFTIDETIEFMDRAGAKTLPEELKKQIYQDTQGNAFLLVQLLGSILEHGEPEVLPDSAEKIMEYRLTGLSREGQKILDIIACFPDYAPYEVLERMSSKAPMDLLYICLELKGRSIIREMTDGDNLALVFAQPEFQELAYSRIQPLNQRILHLNIAKALASSSTAAAVGTISQMIFHYQKGGDERNALLCRIRQLKAQVLPMATLCFPESPAEEITAGSRSYVLNLMEELQNEFDRLRAAYPQDGRLEEMEQELLYAKSCYCVYKGYYALGIKAMERLLSMEVGDDLRDLVHEQMTFYGIQVYDTAVMREHIGKALRLTEGRNAKRYAINYRYYGFLLMMEGNFSEGERELRKSLTLLKAAFPDDPEYAVQAGYAFNYLGEVYRKQGFLEQAVKEYRNGIETILQYGPATCVSIFYNNYAVASFAMGRYDEARRLHKTSQEYLTYTEEPSGYRTISCAYEALYAFADERDEDACLRIRQAEAFADALEGPYDQGIVFLMKAILRSWSDRDPARCPELGKMLGEPCAEYVRRSREKLKGKAALFERQLLEALSEGNAVLTDFLAV